MLNLTLYIFVLQAQLQRSLDSSVSTQPRALIGRRPRKEAALALAMATRNHRQGDGPVSEQDSGILDVEDDEEEDEEVRLKHKHKRMKSIEAKYCASVSEGLLVFMKSSS